MLGAVPGATHQVTENNCVKVTEEIKDVQSWPSQGGCPGENTCHQMHSFAVKLLNPAHQACRHWAWTAGFT